MVCSSPITLSPADLRRGFLVVCSTAYHGEDDGAGRSLSVKWWLPRRETVTRSCVALRVPRGVEDVPAMDAQWFEHLRAATAMEPPRDGADDGRAHGSLWTMQVANAGGEGHHQMFRRDAERPLRETSRRELP